MATSTHRRYSGAVLRKALSEWPALRATVVSLAVLAACRTAPHPSADRRVSASPVEPGVEPSATPAPLPPLPALPSGARIDDEKNTIAVFRQAAPSTVFVTQKRVVVDYLAGTAEEVPAGSGSGFVWDRAGHVVTNFHVVKDAESLSVTFQGQQSFPAKVVGVEPRKDIAVIQVDAPAALLKPVPVEQHVALEVGQKTLAIGNPFGLDHSLTTGIVSALGRQVQGIGGVTIRDMIQTDAAINPGNSGGPLLDSAGQLIGMNTMIFSKSGSSAGIGFAVPVSTIARVVPQIIKSGKAEQLGLGIQIDPLARLERRLGLRGVVVLAVPADSPAAKTGLHGIAQTTRGLLLGDVIIGVDAAKVDDFDDLYNALDVHHAGDRVDVKVRRGDDTATLKLEVIVL
jgi:S1-C subfamily serine protease